jgi:hypothetical protein
MRTRYWVAALVSMNLMGCSTPVSKEHSTAPSYTCYDRYGQPWLVEHPCDHYVAYGQVFYEQYFRPVPPLDAVPFFGSPRTLGEK